MRRSRRKRARILGVLATADEPMRAHHIAREAQIGAGLIYPELAKLVIEGHVASARDAAEPPSDHAPLVYRITEAGMLEAQVAAPS